MTRPFGFRASRQPTDTTADQQRSRRPVIVHVLDRLSTGGMESVAVSLIEGTRDRYHHDVICLRPLEGLGLESRLEALGVDVMTVDKRSGKDLAAYWRLRRLLQRLDPDIVQTYNIGTVDVSLWARLAGVGRVVHAEHGRGAADPTGRNARYRWLRRLMAPAIDVFVPVSYELGDWLTDTVRIPKMQVNVIHNGIDVERFRPGAADASWTTGFASADSTIIGSVGRLNPVKAFGKLIDAFAELNRRVPEADLRLVIAGEGGQRERLTDQIAAHGLEDRVWLAGERADVEALLRSIDIYACSSITEGIALTILEAMASELPVVATRVGGNPELVTPGETGLLVPAGDSTALAGALETLVRDEHKTRMMGKAGRAAVCRDFSLHAMTSAYTNLYDRLLGIENDDACENRAVRR